jgi:hypothetical protein
MLPRGSDGGKPGRCKAQESNGSTPPVIAGESGKHGWPCERKPPERRSQADRADTKAHGWVARGKPRVGCKAGERLWRVKPKSVGG